MDDLQRKLAEVERIFDTESILKIEAKQEYIQKYYRINSLAYTLFHNRHGMLHFAVSRGQRYRDEDLFTIPRMIEEHILPSMEVLELAMGKGANTHYLAQHHQDTSFTGIDLTPEHVRHAQRKMKRLRNVTLLRGDYHNIPSPARKFDVIIIIEGLCHSTQKERVLREVKRVLKPGGKVFIFDGYYREPRTAAERKAQALGAKGMAVEEIEEYTALRTYIRAAGLKIAREEDLSKNVMPNMRRFEDIAARFFRHPRLARLASRVLPDAFTYNAISGYLIPTLLRRGAAQYRMTLLEKPQA